jgi:hypothetical protein
LWTVKWPSALPIVAVPELPEAFGEIHRHKNDDPQAAQAAAAEHKFLANLRAQDFSHTLKWD